MSRPPPSTYRGDPDAGPYDPYADAVVYYVEWNGLIKIGTTIRLAGRMRSLGGQLLVTEPGSYAVETERHRQFAASKAAHGGREWFHPTADLRDHIRVLQGSLR